MRDRGSMLVLTLLVGVAMVTVVLSAMVPFLAEVRAHQRAMAAADAAALAGVLDGRGAASSIAAANGASLVSWSQVGDEVTVAVVVDGARATARATDAP